nr:MAG TPA: hypothetical protein [Caudoviricetes sp.]
MLRRSERHTHLMHGDLSVNDTAPYIKGMLSEMSNVEAK